MKYGKILSISSLVVVLCLLALVIPATPCLAQSIALFPTSGPASSTVQLTGSGFGAYTIVYIFFDTTNVASAAVTAGNISATFAVPATYTTAQTVPVTAQHTTNTYNPANQIAYTTFTVTAALVSLSATSGNVSDQITVNGSGFATSSTITFYWDNNSTGTTTTSNSSGTFTGIVFTIPDSYRGSHTFKAQDATGKSATATFTVQQKITANPTSGGVDDQVTINGTGFTANSTITFYWDNTSTGTTTATTSTGSFPNFAFTVPSSSRGSHIIKAQDASNYSATATFTIQERITITPTSGSSGTTITVTGTGFGNNRTITIRFNSIQVTTSPASIPTGTTGSFTGSFDVPANSAGSYVVEASDGTYTSSANFSIVTEASLSETTGHVGSTITISGSGFTPNGQVEISYDGIPITTTPANSLGEFSATFDIPESTGGNHNITATDTLNTINTTFIMETTPPDAPVPLEPADDTKSGSRAFFDWEDVTDPSGVEYTLQVATDADFTSTSIILEKTGLTESEYTLTDEEKLESVSEEEPYYWRARAVDGALNNSDWTTPASFRVGFTFSIPTWGIYVLFGIGALLLGVLGFWLGRRTAYY